MTEIIINSGNVKAYAGANVLSTITPAQYTIYIEDAQDQVLIDTGVDWATTWVATLSGNAGANAVRSAVANWAAFNAIKQDPAGYTTTSEAAFIANGCLDRYDRAVSKLKDANVYKPLGGVKIT